MYNSHRENRHFWSSGSRGGGIDICWSNARSKFQFCQRGCKLQIGWLAERENKGLGAYRMPKTEPWSLDVMATFCQESASLSLGCCGVTYTSSWAPHDKPASAVNPQFCPDQGGLALAWPACHAKLIHNYFLCKLKLTPHVLVTLSLARPCRSFTPASFHLTEWVKGIEQTALWTIH